MDGFEIVQERSTRVNLVNSIQSVMQDQAEKHFNKGVDFARRGAYAKAVTSFDPALALNPDYSDAKNTGNNLSENRICPLKIT